MLSCVFSIFDAGGSVHGYMCVYTHTRTHTAYGVLDASPGVRTRHLEGPKNLDGKYVFVYENIFSFRKSKAKYLIVKLRNLNEIKSELHRLSIKSTNLLIVICVRHEDRGGERRGS